MSDQHQTGEEILNSVYHARRENAHELKGGFQLHYHFLYEVVFGLETKRALELGTGRSTRVILDALESTGGHLTTCAPRFDFEKLLAGYQDNPQWRYIEALSDDGLPLLTDEDIFDFVLHDGSHFQAEVTRDLKAIVPRMRQFGIILVHDTQHHKLGQGMAAAVTDGLSGVKHSHTTLPYGFGLTIIRIEEDLGHGAVELTRVKRKSGSRSAPRALVQPHAWMTQPRQSSWSLRRLLGR